MLGKLLRVALTRKDVLFRHNALRLFASSAGSSEESSTPRSGIFDPQNPPSNYWGPLNVTHIEVRKGSPADMECMPASIGRRRSGGQTLLCSASHPYSSPHSCSLSIVNC